MEQNLTKIKAELDLYFYLKIRQLISNYLINDTYSLEMSLVYGYH